MDKVLFAWIGRNDLEASRRDDKHSLGPIARAQDKLKFQRIVLLNGFVGQKEEADVPGYLVWLKARTPVSIDSIPVKLSSPMHFSEIYVAAKREVEGVLRSGKGSLRPTFHISPGTSAMATVWIMLAKGPFLNEVDLIHSWKEGGVEGLDIPFNIFTEFIPDVVEGADRRLLMISERLFPVGPGLDDIIGHSSEIKILKAQALRVARHDLSVLIEGETGTGKELFANLIHNASPRFANGQFVPVNCGAIPKELFESEFFGAAKGAYTGADKSRRGLFQQADKGTLFLDEVGEMPMDVQVKLLRLLQGKEVRKLGDERVEKCDVRIIAATNCDLAKAVSERKFRADLYYRLTEVSFRLPPLREREGDLGLLIDEKLKEANTELGKEPSYTRKKISANAKNLLLKHGWPGNVRELENTIKRICFWCAEETIHESDVHRALLPSTSPAGDDILSRHLGAGFRLHELVDTVRATYIRRALIQAGGVKKNAAELVGAPNPTTFSNWIKDLGI